MILAVDVGNTNIVLGLYEGRTLRRHWRLSTNRSATADEYGILLTNLFQLAKVRVEEIEGVVLANVVPPLTPTLERCFRQYAGKEALVIGGRVLLESARASGAELLPIDSEHNAIFQCLPGGYTAGTTPRGVRRMLLTCSGGPFLTLPAERLAEATPEQACAHPRWVMGRKISVDSATLMNKGLELIEACRLFGVAPQQVEIVIHPQSVIHSMVEYDDGSVLAQLGNPDMRIPIAHALAWPERVASGARPIDLLEIARLDFTAPDLERFPCLRLAYAAAEAGGAAPAVLNAANEVAVAAFLERRIAFTDIARIIAAVLEQVPTGADETLAQVLAADARGRAAAEELVGRYAPRMQQEAL